MTLLLAVTCLLEGHASSCPSVECWNYPG